MNLRVNDSLVDCTEIDRDWGDEGATHYNVELVEELAQWNGENKRLLLIVSVQE